MRSIKSLVLALGFLAFAGGAAAQSTAAQSRLDSLRDGRSVQPASSPDAGEVEAQVFVSALEAIAQLHQTSFSDSTLWAAALDGLIESLEDPYASVFTPAEAAEFDEDNTGNYAGIGVQITELNDRVTVTKVFRMTPADQVGMQEGDVIVGVDEYDASAWGSDMVADSVRGPVGSGVEVRVAREGYDGPITFPITRAQVHVPAVESGRMDDDLLYITMDRVARGAAQEMDSVLRENRDASGVLLDLRRNPGGYLDESLMLADLFLDPGQRLASTRSRDPDGSGEFYEESWSARMPPRLPDVPVVILVDEYTASAAEILAGALQDYDRALILGHRTFGKGVVQTVLQLPFGRRLRLTTGAWYTPLGRSLHRTRDDVGRPTDESEDTLPTIQSEGGRELVAAGGIFPDVTIPYDTLTLRERELLRVAAEKQIPLPLRVAEYGFAEAQALRAEGAHEPRLRDESFREFRDALAEEGIPAELMEDPEIVAYLGWRARISTAARMDALGASVEVQLERDTVLAEAIRLLREFRTQPELFAAAQLLREAQEAAEAAESQVGDTETGRDR